MATKHRGGYSRRGLKALGTAFVVAMLTVLPAPSARADLSSEVRASRAQLKGFGYVTIKGKKWCITSGEAEMMIVTSGRPIGETYFASNDQAECALLWRASHKNLRVDISALASQTVTDPIFVGSVKKIYIIGFLWARMR